MILGVAVVVVAVAVARFGRRAVASRGDLAKFVVEGSSRLLGSVRPGWARALVTELGYVEGRADRWRFAVGTVRVALVAGPVAPYRARSPRVAVVAVVTAVVALAGVVQHRVVTGDRLGLGSGAGVEVAATLVAVAALAGQGWVAGRQVQMFSPDAVTARRWGIAAGVPMGVVVLLVVLPLTGDLGVPVAVLPGLVPGVGLVGCLVAGVGAARAAGDRTVGRRAGGWAARVAGAIVTVGLLSATVWAGGWFARDPVTVEAYQAAAGSGRAVGSSTHLGSIAQFVAAQNLDTALMVGLLVFPLLGYASGTLGGRLGAHRGPTPGGEAIAR